jgi:hypothetical protein
MMQIKIQTFFLPLKNKSVHWKLIKQKTLQNLKHLRLVSSGVLAKFRSAMVAKLVFAQYSI